MAYIDISYKINRKGIRTEKRQMMEKERQQKVVGVALSITRSSQMDLASDIKNHLRSIDLFRSMII